MIARNRIWEELKQAKANIICIQRYVDKNRFYNRLYNGFVAITASAGAFGYLLNELIPVIASGLVGLVSIAKSIAPQFLQPETDLSELDAISDFYVSYMNKLEELWYEFDQDITDEHTTMKKFFLLKSTECEKESAMNRGIRYITKHDQLAIDDEATRYIDSVYFKKLENDEEQAC